MSFLNQLLEELPEESRWIIMGQLRFKTPAELYALILQLEQDILKNVVVKRGKDSPEYKFFEQVKDALYQAGEAGYLIDKLNKDLAETNQLNKYLLGRVAELELLLNRFQTLEELAAQGLLESYMNRVQTVMADRLKQQSQQAKVTTPISPEAFIKSISKIPNQ